MRQKQKKNKMVALYGAKLVEVSSERLACVPKERQKRIERCKDLESKKQMLTAGLLLRKVLGIYGIDALAIEKGPNGKPMVEGIHFNLSHTDGLVICAVSDLPVGCDVEKVRQAPEGVAERFFHENERAYLATYSDTFDEQFFRLWTIKESYIKMTGEGMHLPMSEYEICIGEDIFVLRDGKKQNCFIKEYSIPGYQVSVCAEEELFSELAWETLSHTCDFGEKK